MICCLFYFLIQSIYFLIRKLSLLIVMIYLILILLVPVAKVASESKQVRLGGNNC